MRLPLKCIDSIQRDAHIIAVLFAQDSKAAVTELQILLRVERAANQSVFWERTDCAETYLGYLAPGIHEGRVSDDLLLVAHDRVEVVVGTHKPLQFIRARWATRDNLQYPWVAKGDVLKAFAHAVDVGVCHGGRFTDLSTPGVAALDCFRCRIESVAPLLSSRSA